jgi:hypothetical protein
VIAHNLDYVKKTEEWKKNLEIFGSLENIRRPNHTKKWETEWNAAIGKKIPEKSSFGPFQ